MARACLGLKPDVAFFQPKRDGTFCMTQLEICINADDLHSLEANVAAALQGGASRIELCADMQQQGMTPTMLAMQKARQAFATASGLLVMVRFRSDDQIQTKADLASMQLAITQAADAGANGVVLGLLNQQRGLDLPSLDLLVSQAKKLGLQVTFHRAFDAIEHQHQALEQLIERGIDRVLSAGTLWGSDLGVTHGLERLEQLKTQAAGRIELVVGGGVNLGNLAKIVDSLKAADHFWSVHSYSAVLSQGRVDPQKVAAMVRLCQ
jgi:copper homeostasis protein